MEKIREKVTTSFYIRHIDSYWIRNIQDGTLLLHYNNPKRGSPGINQPSQAEDWLNEKEEERLGINNIERPDTKWAFEGFSDVDVRVVLTRQPLLGTGPLPDWLRNLHVVG